MLLLFALFVAVISVMDLEHNVKYPVKSAGPAYLQACNQASTLCPVSNKHYRLHLLLDRLPGHLAPCACAAHRMKLAPITDDNYPAVTKLVKDCVGDYQHVWIHAWNEQNYEGIGLALHSENDGPLKVLPRHNDEPAQVVCIEHF